MKKKKTVNLKLCIFDGDPLSYSYLFVCTAADSSINVNRRKTRFIFEPGVRQKRSIGEDREFTCGLDPISLMKRNMCPGLNMKQRKNKSRQPISLRLVGHIAYYQMYGLQMSSNLRLLWFTLTSCFHV